MMKGVVTSTDTAATMTTDYRQILAGISSYASVKGYKKWPSAIQNRTRPENKVWEVIALDRTKYFTILRLR